MEGEDAECGATHSVRKVLPLIFESLRAVANKELLGPDRQDQKKEQKQHAKDCPDDKR
jgi:hypothetical protein